MTLSRKTVEIYSTGNESLEALGFKNERELEEALIPLMQEKELKEADLIFA